MSYKSEEYVDFHKEFQLQSGILLQKQKQAIPPIRLGFSKGNSGNTPQTLSELYLEFLSRVQLGTAKPSNSRRLKPPEPFQNSVPLSTAGGASFFRSGSGDGLSELVMELPAVLRAFLNKIQIISVATPAEPRSEKKSCANFGQ